MIHMILSLAFVYVFIALGFIAKKIFSNQMDSKTLTLMSVYFTQPFVAMWGFSTASLHLEHIQVAFLYIAIIAILLIPTIFVSKLIFDDAKNRAIFSIAGFVGNTGNIGIPLGIAIFGESSVIYTTLINLANVFVVYIVGVYIYSRGTFDIKTSIKNIFKIPIIPVSIIAILLNISGTHPSAEFKEFLKMGAYAGIVLQLFLLGTFLEGIVIKEVHPKLLIGTLSQKFIMVPLLSAVILHFSSIQPHIQAIILMEMLTPLAVANINLASLYDCRPKDVTTLILISTLLFMPIVFVFEYIVTHYY
jgi:predicted permease